MMGFQAAKVYCCDESNKLSDDAFIHCRRSENKQIKTAVGQLAWLL